MAAPVKLFGKDLKAYEDIDIDKLLETLTEEELEELGQELIDPDVSLLSINGGMLESMMRHEAWKQIPVLNWCSHGNAS